MPVAPAWLTTLLQCLTSQTRSWQLARNSPTFMSPAHLYSCYHAHCHGTSSKFNCFKWKHSPPGMYQLDSKPNITADSMRKRARQLSLPQRNLMARRKAKSQQMMTSVTTVRDLATGSTSAPSFKGTFLPEPIHSFSFPLHSLPFPVSPSFLPFFLSPFLHTSSVTYCVCISDHLTCSQGHLIPSWPSDLFQTT